MAKAISVRLPEELARSLETVARTTDRTKTYLIRKAIETYLDGYADYQIALDRLEDKEDPILDSRVMRKRLGH